MTIKLTEKLYADDEELQTVQFYEKGDKWFSPNLYQQDHELENSTFVATFKRRSTIRLVGPQAEEAWANWKAHADTSRQQ